MKLGTRLIVSVTRFVGEISRRLNVGAGATWPGEIALMLRPDIASSLVKELKKGVILVAGTNGKTTTALMITKILEHQGFDVIHNASGANLLNGVVSAFIQEADWFGNINTDWGVFEIDENSLPIVIDNLYSSSDESSRRREVTRDSSRLRSNNKKLVIVLLNLFRDQLDRYGEVDVIVEKWQKALLKLDSGNQRIKTYHAFEPDTGNQYVKLYQLIVNSDDPGVAWIGMSVKAKVTYFGINDKSEFLKSAEHATDSTFCPNCGSRFIYEGIYYSHIGIWKCSKCTNTRPKTNIFSWPTVLPGLYNRYNTLAAVATAKSLGIADSAIKKSLISFTPAFGRQEEFMIDEKKMKIFLSKNPAGFNASLRTVIEQKAKHFLFVLNDRIPDGRDVSWIWDVDFETLSKNSKIMISGDRSYDMALRLKYADISDKSQISNPKSQIEQNLEKAVRSAISQTPKGQTLFVLATYSAMLEVRKILVGRKIL